MAQTKEELEALLAELDVEEQIVSARRRRLHDRIAHYPEYSDGDLARRERELSDRRRELHALIDGLRSERSGRRYKGEPAA